ncbi:Uncharacterised protein [Mycobacteroides abscessus subsp. abscessus]|nr:Uncharacterised protein [Mycobacteroides abscessus subsp. abscessus]
MRLRSTTRPGRLSEATDSGSPGTASMKASSTTRMRPGRHNASNCSRVCSTPVGLVGFPTTTRSASSGTRTVSPRVNGGGNTTCSRGMPASVRTASGSVNPGATTAARRGFSRGSIAKPSAAPASSSTSSGGRPCRSATASTARCSSSRRG